MKSKIAVAIATWFGSGLIPAIRLPGFPKEMAGTYGSLAALLLCWVVAFLD
ncbi:MAG: hypothetical protein M1275_04005 [Patescibacteria group bacterium]|nr:hypothetical protein [Patescibacteria group bacterium]